MAKKKISLILLTAGLLVGCGQSSPKPNYWIVEGVELVDSEKSTYRLKYAYDADFYDGIETTIYIRAERARWAAGDTLFMNFTKVHNAVISDS